MTDKEKQNNFKRIAERRTNEILAKINSFKNFRNNSFYIYTDAQLKVIRDAIESELNEIWEALERR